jgi:hypothetical protein
MTMPTDFQSGSDWEQSSDPKTYVTIHEMDVWPVADNSESGTKDSLAAGLHPVVAVGPRAAGDVRPMNLVGVVVSYTPVAAAGVADPTGVVTLNIANGAIVRQYVNNTLTYAGTHAATWDIAPVFGQPVYVDDSHDLSEGVTLSLSPLNEDGLKNPLAGYLWYCQDEMANASVGGPNALPTFDTALLATRVEQEYCVLLINAGRELI